LSFRPLLPETFEGFPCPPAPPIAALPRTPYPNRTPPNSVFARLKNGPEFTSGINESLAFPRCPREHFARPPIPCWLVALIRSRSTVGSLKLGSVLSPFCCSGPLPQTTRIHGQLLFPRPRNESSCNHLVARIVVLIGGSPKEGRLR